MSNFFFFTDPSLLNAQLEAQAFGPAGTAAGKELFRITDIHTSTASTISAFAICDGLICAQVDVGGTLSLILKPIEQPPFDFPFISYIIYKGIDPTSILTNGNAGPGGMIDVSKASDNKLVDMVQKTWAANNNSSEPTRECLGLHLTPASTAADYPDLDLSKYADGEPLDNVFYQGDDRVQLPLVRGGWRIGAFANTSFGLEIVTERISYRPRITLTRKLANVIEVTSLNPGATPAPNDKTFFMHWHAKEECLNFIDPCAFWGSFFAAKLRVWDATHSEFDRKSGKETYETVLRASHDDSSAAAGAFYNRNRVHIDIRNEHNQSLNYYKDYGDSIQLSFDGNTAIENELENYYGTSWPYLAVAKTDLAGGIGKKTNLYFGLPSGDNPKPLLFLAAGSTKQRGQARRSRRFIELLSNDSTGFTERASVSIPVYDDGQTARTVACYLKICCFKRVTPETGIAPSAGSVAPNKQNVFDFALRLPVESANLTGQGFCFYNDAILVDQEGSQTSQPGSHVAVPFCAFDDEHAYFFLLPWFFVLEWQRDDGA